MLANLQSFVQRRFHLLMMLLVAAGFLLIFFELVLYKHFEGLQLIGTGATIVGAAVALLGISASGNRRRMLAVAFIALALTGLLGAFEHNEERLGGEEGERRPPAAQTTGGQAAGESDEQGEQDEQENQAGEAQGEEEGESETPPPPLAPLSLSGFCVLGAVALLGRKDPL